jgi:superfamily II DNA or RNA helicase
METMDFLPRLSKFLDQLRMESAFQDSMELISLENPRKTGDLSPPGSEPSLSDSSGTQTHQNDALAAAIKAGHGVLSLPCGYGKTTVSLAIACKLGYRTMIIVHKQFLADQWRERIQQFCPGATIGVVQQDKKRGGV